MSFKDMSKIAFDIINESEGTVKSAKNLVGKGFEGFEKAKETKEGAPKAPKMAEGPSNDEEDGKAKPLKKTEAKKIIKDSKHFMRFDQLVAQTLKEADNFDTEDEGITDVVPASDVESDNFNEDEGDFDEESDIGEEVDVATELKMISDRLLEIVDKLGGIGTEDETLEDEDMTDEIGDEDVEGLDNEEVKTESIKSEPTPKPAKKTSFNPNMKQVPKNKITKKGASKAKCSCGSKDMTGKPSPASKSSFGPNMSPKVSGTGPAVSGKDSLIQ